MTLWMQVIPVKLMQFWKKLYHISGSVRTEQKKNHSAYVQVKRWQLWHWKILSESAAVITQKIWCISIFALQQRNLDYEL